MTGGHLWTIARNATGRPTLQHAVTSTADTYTACGWPISGWSRTYVSDPIPTITCKRCAIVTGTSLTSVSRTRLSLIS